MLVIQRPTVESIGDEDNHRQRFAVGPLEPGFGHTIGNSLRRGRVWGLPGRGTPPRRPFAVGPLEPGFGHTIGNSLRRVLLSSIPGAAITAVRFDDALHEFDTINGVAEDINHLHPNLNDNGPTSAAEEAVTLRLDVRGPATVTAGDIECPADVEIL